MTGLINNLKQKAKEKPKRIVLPEGEEERIIKAAGIISQKKIAIPLLLGNVEKIKEKARYLQIDLKNIEIILIIPWEKKAF